MGACARKVTTMNQWYLLYCKSQDAVKINDRVGRLGVSSFYPHYVKVTKRQDCNAVRTEDKPLFPNYLFLSFDINEVHTSDITSIPGAIGFVRFGANPCTVSDKVISAIKCARLVSLNEEEGAIECRNISPDLLQKVQALSLIKSVQTRQVAFSKLLESDDL